MLAVMVSMFYPVDRAGQPVSTVSGQLRLPCPTGTASARQLIIANRPVSGNEHFLISTI